MARTTPFFIVGSVRSGTTLLRDLLRRHRNLECPEETNFYRDAEPFGTVAFNERFCSKLMEHHRHLDGVPDDEFFAALGRLNNRRELSDWYNERILARSSTGAQRWFDKTPQNAYGMMLVRQDYPGAKFVHIHRHPLNVVASLQTNDVMRIHDIRGCIGYWNEALGLIKQYQQMRPNEVFNIRYDQFVSTPAIHLRRLLDFVEEDPNGMDYGNMNTYAERNSYKTQLSSEVIDLVLSHTQSLRDYWGYG